MFTCWSLRNSFFVSMVMFDFELVQAIMATFLQFVEIDAKLPYLNELKRLCRKKSGHGGATPVLQKLPALWMCIHALTHWFFF